MQKKMNFLTVFLFFVYFFSHFPDVTDMFKGSKKDNQSWSMEMSVT